LLDNAVKFSGPGGEVLIAAHADARGTRIAVSDHGPGIPEPDLEHAADRFFRGEAARNTPGSGLGLALVQAVAQLHGGTLSLEDTAPGLRAALDLPTHGGG
jgi:signal transduction histidine kinase